MNAYDFSRDMKWFDGISMVKDLVVVVESWKHLMALRTEWHFGVFADVVVVDVA